ncbi:MAG TPA: lipopolysaccharide heptosyltransferase II [Gemmatimonadales bacterium]|nr:lipopolysaccharide heptosyltransferase II [Gemmatimonadales bacterium]
MSGTLVIQTAFLGDVVLTTPLLERLASEHGPVDVLVTPAAAALLRGHPAVGEVIAYDKRGRDAGLRGWLRMAKALRSRDYDRVYVPHRSVRSAALAIAADSLVRIGFTDAAAPWLYSERVVVQGSHETERIASLAGPGPVPRPSLGLTESERREAAEWLEQAGVRREFVALAPGSVWATKRWPYYADLAARIPGSIVVLGGPEDREAGEEIVSRDPARIRSASGALPLRISAALIERASVLVTNDSAPLHIAGAVGTRVVAIFGPTVPAFGFGPLGAQDVIAEVHHLTCRPCSKHGPMVCPLLHHRCMKDLAVSEVLALVTRDS